MPISVVRSKGEIPGEIINEPLDLLVVKYSFRRAVLASQIEQLACDPWSKEAEPREYQ